MLSFEQATALILLGLRVQAHPKTDRHLLIYRKIDDRSLTCPHEGITSERYELAGSVYQTEALPELAKQLFELYLQGFKR